MPNPEDKLAMPARFRQLVARLAACDSIAVAFSGGVDSTFLLAAAVYALGRQKVLAILGESALRPRRELEKARQLAAGIGVDLRRVATRELACENFIANPPERCYLCKRHLLGLALEAARKWQPEALLVEGSNLDDDRRYRPGFRAVCELGIGSPLRETGFTKAEIRSASRLLGLPTWNRPAFSCLATRIPHFSPITVERLKRIEQAEALLKEEGFAPVRVRDNRELCRIELEPQDWPRFLRSGRRPALVGRLKNLGYRFVTLDLDGFRSGSLEAKPEISPEGKKSLRNKEKPNKTS